MLVSAAVTRSSGTQHVRGDLPLGAAKGIQPVGPHVTVQRQHRRDQRCRFSGRIVSGQEQPPVRDIEGEQSEVPVVAQDDPVQLIARWRTAGTAQMGDAGQTYLFRINAPNIDAFTVTVTSAGDFNANSVVDAADYVMWRKDNGSQTDYKDHQGGWNGCFDLLERVLGGSRV